MEYEDVFESEFVGWVRIGPQHKAVVLLMDNGEFRVWKVKDDGKDLVPEIAGRYIAFTLDYSAGKILIIPGEGPIIIEDPIVLYIRRHPIPNTCILME